jgi:hypothetical protein
VAAQVHYYAIVTVTRNVRAAAGLARRAFAADGPVDETLRRDLSWQSDSAIIEWEYGDVGAELVRVSETEADQLTESFRAKWHDPRDHGITG